LKLENQYKKKRLSKLYNTEVEAYELLMERQKSCCGICWKKPEPGQRGLMVDHNHRTGKLRGLICGTCNVGLGMFYDNPASLLRAIEYLKEATD